MISTEIQQRSFITSNLDTIFISLITHSFLGLKSIHNNNNNNNDEANNKSVTKFCYTNQMVRLIPSLSILVNSTLTKQQKYLL